MHEVMKEAGVDLQIPLPPHDVRRGDGPLRLRPSRHPLRHGARTACASVFASSEFKVFAGALASGGVVKGINAKGAGDWSRGKIDALNQVALDAGAKGLAWVAFPTEGDVRSPIAKFFTEAEMAGLREALAIEPGDLALHDRRRTRPRERGARRAAPARWPTSSRSASDGFDALWVVDFPMFKYDAEEERYAANHHPFTHARSRTLEKIESAPLEVGSYSYDLVMNGYEIGGGTLRIHNADLQMRVLGRLGHTERGGDARSSASCSRRSRSVRRRTVASRSDSTASSCCSRGRTPSATSSRSRRPPRAPIRSPARRTR